MKGHDRLFRMVLAAVLLALAEVLPFFTGQLRTLGNALCPMHFPVLLAGFFCGPLYAAAVGFLAPLLRFALFGLPPLMPIGISMCFELTTYGLLSGLLYKALPKKPWGIYVSLIGAMLAGRIVWGCARTVLYGLGKAPFGFTVFISGAFTTALPGIILQLILIPLIVMALEKALPRKR